MNERALLSMATSQSPDGTMIESQAERNETSCELLGAVDIVEAFTTLRHELKLQVRGGRELQQSLQDSLLRLEQRITSQSAAQSEVGTSEGRKMAEAIADIEESLQRAIESIVPKPVNARSEGVVLKRYDQLVSKAPWIARAFAGRWLEELRAGIAQSIEAEKKSESTSDPSHRGLELLLARVHRLMKQFEIERVNVLYKAFDAETMNAIDMVVAPDVASAHVAQQLRPLYLWRNITLRCAEVRIAT